MSAETDKMLDRYDELVDNKFAGWTTTAEDEEFKLLRAEILRQMALFDPSGGER